MTSISLKIIWRSLFFGTVAVLCIAAIMAIVQHQRDVLPNSHIEIKQPLETATYEANPCQSLSAEQTRTLGLQSPGLPITDMGQTMGAGPTCQWQYANKFNSFHVTFMTHTVSPQFGMANIYALGGDGDKPGSFKQTTIAGYPAVYTAVARHVDDGMCILHTGLKQDFVLQTWVQILDMDNSEAKKPCDRLAEATESIIATLKK